MSGITYSDNSDSLYSAAAFTASDARNAADTFALFLAPNVDNAALYASALAAASCSNATPMYDDLSAADTAFDNTVWCSNAAKLALNVASSALVLASTANLNFSAASRSSWSFFVASTALMVVIVSMANVKLKIENNIFVFINKHTLFIKLHIRI